jgi:hypothetical protein
MELIHYFIWLVVVFLLSWILFLLILKASNKEKNKHAVTWALIFALFTSFIYSLVALPFITYNDCASSGILLSILLGSGTNTCNKVLRLSLLFTYSAIFLTLIALLFTTVE